MIEVMRLRIGLREIFKGKAKAKVKVLRAEPTILGAVLICEVNGEELRVFVDENDKSPEEAIKRHLEQFAYFKKARGRAFEKARSWVGKEFYVEVEKEDEKP